MSQMFFSSDGDIAVGALEHLFYSLEAERGAEILATALAVAMLAF